MKPVATCFPYDTNFNFMRLRWVVAGDHALLTMLVAIGAMAAKGFNYALDFTGGTVVELRFDKPVDVDGVRERLRRRRLRQRAGADLRQRQRPAGAPAAARGRQRRRRAARTARAKYGVRHRRRTIRRDRRRSEFVGAQVGKELAINGLYALLFVVVGFLIYICVPLRVEVRGRGHHHHPARRA